MEKLCALALFLMLSFINTFSQSATATIQGKIITSDNKPAAYVSVLIKSTARGTVTDEEGKFSFNRLKSGTYTIQVSLTGYENEEQTVTIEDSKPVTLSFTLRISDTQLQEVVIKSGRNPYGLRNGSSTLRLNEPLLEVPQNIQVITATSLSDQQVTSMSDGVLRNVSGAIRLEHWADMYTNVFMRGSRVSAFRNGMNVATSYWSPLTEDMSIVDHIEFVKGPSGFMMAVGDPAGFYNVVTKKPTGVNKGEVNFMIGSYGLYRAAADVDGKLDSAGKLTYRLNVMGQSKNSFRPYEFNNRYLVAPVVSYKLDDKTTLTAEYLLQKVKMSDVGSYYVFSNKGFGVLPRNFTTAEPGLEPTYITDQSITLNLQRRLSENWKLTVQVAYFNCKQQGTDLWPSYVGADSMVRGIGIWDAMSEAKFGQAFINGKIQTGNIQHRILAGVDMNDKDYWADWNQYHLLDTDESKFSLNNPVYGSPANGYPVWDRSKGLRERAGQYGYVGQTYTGIYVQDELGFFGNRLRLTLAARYSMVKNNDYNTVSTAERISPRIGVSVSVDKQTSAYALLDQAFVPQSGIKKDGSSIKPLTGNNVEAGIKRVWADGRWNSSVSVYRIIRNNENASDPGDPTGRYIVQLGQTVSKGVELDIKGEIMKGLTLTANYALTDSKISKTDTSAASQAKIGQKVPGYAKHTANAWLNYQVSDGILKGAGVAAGFSFLGDRNTWEWGSTSAPFIQMPDYTRFDGGIFWENEKLRMSLNVFNIAGKFLYSGSGYGNYYYWQAEPGRNLRFSVGYRF